MVHSIICTVPMQTAYSDVVSFISPEVISLGFYCHVVVVSVQRRLNRYNTFLWYLPVSPEPVGSQFLNLNIRSKTMSHLINMHFFWRGSAAFCQFKS